MPVYYAEDKVKSGVPLGGMGAGKIEILPNGLFNAFTFQNNWSNPILGDDHYPGILGYHLGLSVQFTKNHHHTKKAFLLQTAPVLNIPTVHRIKYEGIFPRAKLWYEEPDLGLEISLETFSPWIPLDVKNSSLPVAFFDLKVKNLNKFPVDVGFIFIGRNLCGEWCVGRKNKVFEKKKSLDLEFSNCDPASHDTRHGSIRFSFVKDSWQLSYLESWNAVVKNFLFNSQNISLLGWDLFAKNGELPNTQSNFIAQGENQELCGAVAARQLIRPHREKTLSFSAAWYFPRHPLGHRYEQWFKNAGEVSQYASDSKSELSRKTGHIEKTVFSLPFPRWFNEALLVNLAPFFSSSWFVKDGRFSFYEAPVICPLMGTLDVGFYGSIPLSYFFPELEISLICQFAKSQRKDGYVPHDLGRNRLDMPSNGTTFHQWKDLNPKFILMVYRDYLWSGDLKFLKNLYPHVKRALAWSMAKDFDGNGLPDHEGADQTFDLWEFYGANAYTSSLFLAALRACIRMARLLRDRAFADDCENYFIKGSLSFERELWNGQYFGDFCALSQLNGQWYADLLNLGPIVDKSKIKKAIAYILKNNRGHSSFGMVNSIFKDGRLDTTNDHSKNIWSGMNYAFISLCLMEGFPLRNLLKEAHKIWDNIASVQKSPWNQPDTIDSQTGEFVFGDSYYRNMAIWSIPIAYAMQNKRTAMILNSLRGHAKKGARSSS